MQNSSSVSVGWKGGLPDKGVREVIPWMYLMQAPGAIVGLK